MLNGPFLLHIVWTWLIPSYFISTWISIFFAERRAIDSIASVATKLGFGPFSLFIDKKRIKKRVNFYRLQLGFPETGSEEYLKLSGELQKRVKRFDLGRDKKSGQDFLEWMKSFDYSNQYNIRIRGPFILTKRPFKFVDLFLQQVLLEMESAANAIFDEAGPKWLWTRFKYWYLNIKIWFMKYWHNHKPFLHN